MCWLRNGEITAILILGTAQTLSPVEAEYLVGCGGHPESVMGCSLAVCSRLNNHSFSLQFNNSNSGLFTVNTGMKNISQVHMVESWNGLKEVSGWQPAFFGECLIESRVS